jgi:antitoxin CcdA
MKPQEHSVAEAKTPPRKATNITLPLDVYQDARHFGINISQVAEHGLREEIQARRERQWNQDNARFIAAYNRLVEEEGVALQEWRAF